MNIKFRGGLLGLKDFLMLFEVNTVLIKVNAASAKVKTTPYDLLRDCKPDLKFLHVFSTLCYPTNDSEDIGKLKPKADIGIFIGYSPSKKAYRIYNKRTRLIMETIHVQFDKLTQMAFEQHDPGPELQSLTYGQISSGLVPNSASSTSNNLPSKNDLNILFQPMFDEYFKPLQSVVSPTISAGTLPTDIAGITSLILVDQDTPSPSRDEQKNQRPRSKPRTKSEPKRTKLELEPPVSVLVLSLRFFGSWFSNPSVLVPVPMVLDPCSSLSPSTTPNTEKISTPIQDANVEELNQENKDAEFNRDTSTNPFAPLDTSSTKSSSSRIVDTSNMHTFQQTNSHIQKWMKDHPSDTRPPMLDRSNFESWQQRIRLYCLGKENKENILKSIDEGPFKMGKFRETLAEGALHLGPERDRVFTYLTLEEKERYKADIRAMNIVRTKIRNSSWIVYSLRLFRPHLG
ncbi:retrovirus-related pol polyprotein from transposon TNT 1-94 [Tanacetum coccineum]